MLEFLNHNSGALAVIFSFVVAFATIIYAILTWKLVSETRRMREVQTEPKVSVIIQPREERINFIDMVIQNVGLGPAYNIKFEINPDFEYINGKTLSELGFIKNGLPYLAPKQKLQFFLTDMTKNFEEKIKKSFKIKVIYQNGIGKSYEDVYIIDFSQLTGLVHFGDHPLYKIAKEIEEIRKDIHRITTEFHGIRMDMLTEEHFEEGMKKQLNQANQFRKKIKK